MKGVEWVEAALIFSKQWVLVYVTPYLVHGWGWSWDGIPPLPDLVEGNPLYNPNNPCVKRVVVLCLFSPTSIINYYTNINYIILLIVYMCSLILHPPICWVTNYSTMSLLIANNKAKTNDFIFTPTSLRFQNVSDLVRQVGASCYPNLRLRSHLITLHPLLCTNGPHILQMCALGILASVGKYQNNQLHARSFYFPFVAIRLA